MPGRQTADVVFCLDASGSMQPCFDALRKHVQSFVKGLEAGGQSTWDLRLDFLAHCAGQDGDETAFRFRSLYHQNWKELHQALYTRPLLQFSSGKFFTANIKEFCKRIEEVKPEGDEATFVALDTALDFPWREAASCHRILVLMTDEALETGLEIPWQVGKIPALIEKLHALRVKLFIVGPASDAFDAICAADRSEFQVLASAHDGLKNANFQQILGEIGKSVSASALQGPATPPKVTRGLFNQPNWVASSIHIKGD